MLTIIVGVVVLVLVGVFVVKSGKSAVGTTSPTASKMGKYDTVFPMPSSVEGFTKADEDRINYQTKLSVKEAEEFYRVGLTKMGLTERTINTATTDTTFSMIFDGYENGKAIVVQGVDLQGKTNVNVRFEQV